MTSIGKYIDSFVLKIGRKTSTLLATRWHKKLSTFEPKVQVSISDHLYSNVRLAVRLSVNFSRYRLLL